MSFLARISKMHPLLRGMLSYSIVWPCSSLTQEYLEFGIGLGDADWHRALRFSIFGTFFMCPVYYSWCRLTTPYFKTNTLRSAMKRAAIEQVSYGPLALSYFLFGMSLMEMKTVTESINEVKRKFWPTYLVGVFYWPTAQTINFYFITQKNRLVFVSAVSYIFTVFLAHMKSKNYLEEDMKSGKNTVKSLK